MVLSICHQADLQVQSTKNINMHSNGPRKNLNVYNSDFLIIIDRDVIPVSDTRV